jgi:hypothetical protein
MFHDINYRDLYGLLKRTIERTAGGELTVEATAGMLSHLFTLALSGDLHEFRQWLSNEAILQSWIDGQMSRPTNRADNDHLPSEKDPLGSDDLNGPCRSTCEPPPSLPRLLGRLT